MSRSASVVGFGCVALVLGGASVLQQYSGGSQPELEPEPQVFRTPLQPTFRFEDVSFVTERSGWILESGAILRTTDGGTNWTSQSLGIGSLRSIAFANEQTGWLGTLNPTRVLYATFDGGASWVDVTHRIIGPRVTGICGVSVVSSTTVYAVGRYDGPARFLRSSDGGRTWAASDLSMHAAKLVDVFFHDVQNGVIVGGTELGAAGRAVVLSTNDGGRTWTVAHVSADEEEWAWKISFPSRDTGYVSVESERRGKLLRTTDGGISWHELRVPVAESIQGVGFLSANTGWIGGDTGTWFTRNGGVTWQRSRLPNRLNRVRVLNGSVIYAAGSHAAVMRYPDDGFRHR